MSTPFTARLRDAIELLSAEPSLRSKPCRSGSLFSVVYRGGKYEWVKVMDSDGLLVGERKVHDGEGRPPEKEVSLWLGIVVQSEDATSQTKPNPLGKASLSHVPYGVWVDLNDGGRRRLDRAVVVFVLPKGAAPRLRKKFSTARRNVVNASDMMPDAIRIEVPRGAAAEVIADRMKSTVRPYLVGRGRPKGGA